MAASEGLEDRCLLTPLLADGSTTIFENTPDNTIVFDVNDANTNDDFDIDLDPLTYSIVGGNTGDAFQIDPATGEISVLDQRPVDFETNPVFQLEVEATDGVDDPSRATITINIENLNEDISLNDAFLVDGNLTTILSPFLGETIGVQALYETENLPAALDYSIEYRIDGVPLANEGITNGAGEHMTPPQFWEDLQEGWFATGGTHTVEVIVDADNTVTEDDETNNTITFTFTSVTASPPVQFSWPLDGEPQENFYITGYVDIDPTQDDNTEDDERDYQGGFHTFDNTTGWHISPTTFNEQDFNIPVYAAADGVVAAVNDGEFDRNFEPLEEPFPDPLPESNFITINHGDGYTTTYSRLRQNSVFLQPGDPVVEGQLVGLIGSSGPDAFEPALHWEVARNGRPIETLLDPSIYLNDLPDYSGSFSFVRRSFFTQCLPTNPFNPCPNPINFEDFNPYDFRPHILEGPSSVDYFPVTGDQPVNVFVEFGTIRTGDTLEAVWRRPDGTEYARDASVADREDYSAEFWWEQILPPEAIQGTWTVEFLQNGAQVGEDSFEIQLEEFPDIRVERQSTFFPARVDFPEDIYVDERYTPVDLDQAGGGEFGGDPDETWTIHNQGTAVLEIDEILVPEAFQFDVYDKLGTLLTTFPGANSFAGGAEAPLLTDPGGASYILVQPVPGLDPGYYSGMVRIFTNDPEEQDYNISIESRIPGGDRTLEIGIASRDIFEDPTTGDLRTRLVANVRRLGDTPETLDEELVVDLVAEVSDVTFPGNVRLAPGEDYASFYIETFDDNQIEGFEYLRIGAVDRDTDDPYLPAFTTLRIVDDDFAGIDVADTDGTTIVDENGSTDTFQLTLPAEPITNVVLDLTTSDNGEAVVSPSQIVFTPLNWNIPQTVTVIGIDDSATDGDIDSNVIISVNDFLSDNDFDPVEDVLVPIITVDNDVPGFLITQPDGDTTVDESGTTDSVLLRLTRAPQEDVLFDVMVGDLGEATINVGSVLFTPDNWDQDQAVIVSGVNDEFVDGTVSSSLTFVIRDSASDQDWVDVADQSIAVSTTDDETAGFTITETADIPGGLLETIVSESGNTDTFQITLDDLPLTDVRLQLQVDDATEVAISPATLRFTPINGTIPQTVTVTGLDDTFVDLNQISFITVSVFDGQSNDFFDALPDQTVEVETIDDDIAAFTVTQSDGTTIVGENGLTDTIQVVLNSEPATDVVLDVSVSDLTEFNFAGQSPAVSTVSLTFTPLNWQSPQALTFIGPQDSDVDGDISDFVTVSVNAGLSDDEFDVLPDQPIAITNVDDEIAEIIVAETNGNTIVSEDGSISDSFDVTLTGAPLTDVVLEIVSNDLTETLVSPLRLTFNGGNYDVPQTISIAGMQDDFVDGDIMSQIAIRVVGTESHVAFNSAMDQSVRVVTIDDEEAAIVITQDGGTTIVSEDGTTDFVRVALQDRPATDVVIDIASADTGEASVSPIRLVFTPDNWNDEQLVTVSGVDDVLADGSVSTLVSFTVDGADSDGLFSGVANDITVLTTDNDTASFTVTETGIHTLAREGGNTDEVEVVLDAAPLSPVTIDVSSQDTAQTTPSPASVTFDATNWNVPQTVTFTAVDDSAQDGRNFTTADFAVRPGSNAMFVGESDSIVVITIDNDAPVFLDDTDLIINATSNDDSISITEALGTITVTLNGDMFPFTVGDYDRILLSALAGDDLILATSVTTPLLVKGGAGEDTIFGGTGADTLRGGGDSDTLVGGDGDDLLNGGNSRDTIQGGNGADEILGGRGLDTISGGVGDDSIRGEGGRDILTGGVGNDTLVGGNGRDSIQGDSGDDAISGGSGNDTIFGGSGIDVITGGSGQDQVFGEADADLIIGGSGNDTVIGGDGRDVVAGGTGVDVIEGNDGEDILLAGRISLSLNAMESILAEWQSDNSYQERVDNIHDGPEQTADRLNTAFLIGPDRPGTVQTAFDDDNRDELAGGSGNDFFFANVEMRDLLEDNTLSEWVDVI